MDLDANTGGSVGARRQHQRQNKAADGGLTRQKVRENIGTIKGEAKGQTQGRK